MNSKQQVKRKVGLVRVQIAVNFILRIPPLFNLGPISQGLAFSSLHKELKQD